MYLHQLTVLHSYQFGFYSPVALSVYIIAIYALFVNGILFLKNKIYDVCFWLWLRL